MEIITNPNHRCVYCKGREVLNIENEVVIDSNLILVEGKFYCKDKTECKKNIQSENTELDLAIDENNKIKTVKITSFGNELLNIDDDSDSII